MGTPAKTPHDEFLTGRKSEARTPAASVLRGGRPKFPKGLRDIPEVKTEWKRVCRLLERRGHLTEADGPILFLYASAYRRWLQAEADIQAKGIRYMVDVFDRNGNVTGQREKRNESVADAAMLRKELLQHLTALGLTPQSRDKVRLTADKATPPAVDEVEDFFSGPRLVPSVPTTHSDDEQGEEE
jgi:P27 family predicted phage terminase small subunit